MTVAMVCLLFLFSIIFVSGRSFNVLILLICVLPFQDFVLMLMAGPLGVPSDIVKPLMLWKEVLIVALFGKIVARILLNGKLEISFCAVDRAVIIYIVVIIVTAIANMIFSRHHCPPFMATLVGARTLLLAPCLYLIGRICSFSEEDMKSCTRVLLVVSCIVAIFGILEWSFRNDHMWRSIGYFELSAMKGVPQVILAKGESDLFYSHFGGLHLRRLISFYGSPLTVAYSFLTVIPLGLVHLLTRNSEVIRTKLQGVMLFVIITVALVLTFTRAAIVGAICGLTVLCVRLKKPMSLLFIFVISAACLAMFHRTITDIVESTITLRDTSAAAHFAAYQHGLEVVFQNPFGLGVGTGGWVGHRFYGEGGVGESLYLTIASETGWIGLTSFIAIIFFLILNLRKIESPPDRPFLQATASALLAATIGYVLGSLTTEHWFGFQSSAIYWWLCGSLVTLTSRKGIRSS